MTISVVWAIEQDLVMRYGPWCRILLCALSHMQDFVMCYGSQRRILLCSIGHSTKIITLAHNYTNFFTSLPNSLKGHRGYKVNLFKQFYPIPMPSLCQKSLVLVKTNLQSEVAHSAERFLVNSKQNL